MGDLTTNISRSEIACKCGCGQDSIDFKVIEMVQWACDYWALKLGVAKVVCHIVSGARCDWWNGHEKGARKSLHLLGRAIDFRIDGVKHQALYDSLDKKYNGFGGLGVYSWGVHVDSRTTSAARW